MAVVPPEVMGRAATVGAYFLGAILFILGEERLAGVPWRRFLAWALGDTMVVVFFGWLVLILGGCIRNYIGIFELT
jgi:hypothetical protein